MYLQDNCQAHQHLLTMWSVQVLRKVLKWPFHLYLNVMQRASKAAFLNFYHFIVKHNQFSWVHLCTVFKRFGRLFVCKHLGNLALDLGLRVFQLFQSLYVHKSQIDSMMSKSWLQRGPYHLLQNSVFLLSLKIALWLYVWETYACSILDKSDAFPVVFCDGEEFKQP